MRDIITNSFCHILNRTRRHMCEACRWASSATPNSPRRVIPPALRVNIAVTIVSDSELFPTALVLYNWKEDTTTRNVCTDMNFCCRNRQYHGRLNVETPRTTAAATAGDKDAAAP